MYMDCLDQEAALFNVAVKRARGLRSALKMIGVKHCVRVEAEGQFCDPEVTLIGGKKGYSIQVCTYVVGGCPFIVQRFDGKVLRTISEHRGTMTAARAFAKVAL
jgi:hypothetical protein